MVTERHDSVIYDDGVPPPPVFAIYAAHIAIGPIVSENSPGEWLVDLGKLAGALTAIGILVAGVVTIVVKTVRKDMNVQQIPEILAIVTELRNQQLGQRVTALEDRMDTLGAQMDARVDGLTSEVAHLSGEVEALVARDAILGGRRRGVAPGDLTP